MLVSIESRMQEFLKAHRLRLAKQERISKGYSSEIYLVKNAKGKRFALKIEKEKSPRKEMVEKEAANLKLANKYGIGSKLIDYDTKRRIILMEFVSGTTFCKWLFEKKPNKKELEKVIADLLLQAKILDEIGLDHGQLAGKGTNIIIAQNLKPVIVDFEKASQKRKCHNFNQLRAFLFFNKHSAIAKKICGLLGKNRKDYQHKIHLRNKF